MDFVLILPTSQVIKDEKHEADQTENLTIRVRKFDQKWGKKAEDVYDHFVLLKLWSCEICISLPLS